MGILRVEGVKRRTSVYRTPHTSFLLADAPYGELTLTYTDGTTANLGKVQNVQSQGSSNGSSVAAISLGALVLIPLGLLALLSVPAVQQTIAPIAAQFGIQLPAAR